MISTKVVSRDEWLSARKQLLAEEKQLTRLRDELARKRRELPRVHVDEAYVFEGPDGKQSLADLFAGKSQLIVQHFMLGEGWGEGCPSCSFWADNYNGTVVHMQQRDASFVAVSNAPLAEIQAYKKRMGWSFKWVSSFGTDFNRDYHVTFTEDERANNEAFYNFKKGTFPVAEAPGVSVFYKDEQGEIFHTYSCYARGLDTLNAAYQYIDLLPHGRNEDDLPFSMAWLKRHDQYEA